MSLQWTSVLLLLRMSCYFSFGSCGKLLVWPTEYSHWISMKTILDELAERGHEVVALTPTTSIQMDSSKPSAIKFEVVPSSLKKEDWEHHVGQLLSLWTNDTAKDVPWRYLQKIKELFWKSFDLAEIGCKDVILNKDIMAKLTQESGFDLILADAVAPCAELLAELLKVPFVYTLRFTPGNIFTKYSGKLPLPPSYVPVCLSELSDHMTFMERVKNMIYMLYFEFHFKKFSEKWNQLYSEVLGKPTTLFELMGKAEMWLIRDYWNFGYPHPLLPNFEFVGGFHCKPAKPLPKEMEEFAQSSGENGIVVFSLGSMISNLPEERANVIASALAQIPQKVLWRFDGKKPATLGANTRLYKWLPQNDLLGHPKTKAFITHGGANGIFEAIYHGVPMVGIPLFVDQPENMAHMKVKGAAVVLDIQRMSSTDLLNALKTVINDPSYKENVMKLSRIQHDQPMKPLDRAVFWIEFVMRNKGAKHLRPASHDLTWAQLHSLDVIGFLLACVATAVYGITKCCLFCCRKVVKTRKDKRE
ncbi:PREDICTED: UDP-glucuronosyltransferase 2B31-like isoform X1 [Condylura cristata]|uniref:UDP-glucuronosyltransferase 2B31-like isoform X1 n=1 Tax=Condylura cristata TaxID=143302 RepID=UPI0003346CAD|nr:PREDICTED: UDP-glucuronosyltransferase 2B31-like isoform X1 [Condylura cristata]